MKMPPIYFEWREFWLSELRYKGRGRKQGYKRPAHIPKPTPLWWTMTAAFLAKRIVTGPRPTPYPTMDSYRFDLWRSKGGWIAWGLQNGQYTPRSMAQIARARGCSWVGIQDLPANRAMREQIKAELAGHGLKLVVWEWITTPEKALEVIDFWKPHGYAANVEHRGPWNIFAARVRTAHPYLPLAVWTNFAGAGAMPDGSYSQEEAGWFWSQDFACITESYMVNEQGAQPSLSPDRLNWTASVKLGYKVIVHSFGIYRCPPSFYDQYVTAWPHHSWYLMEYLPEARS